MKKLIAAATVVAATTVGFSATASASGHPANERANDAAHASIASSLQGGTADVMPCHVASFLCD